MNDCMIDPRTCISNSPFVQNYDYLNYTIKHNIIIDFIFKKYNNK